MTEYIRKFLKKFGAMGITLTSGADATDPVCGMKASGNLFSSAYQGKNYYFCSDYCQKEFDAHPQQYLG